jgi:hypothetical protein
MPVIPALREVDKNRIIGKNGGPRRRGKSTKRTLLSRLSRARFLKK